MNIFRKCAELVDEGRQLALITVVAAGTGSPGKVGFKLALSDTGETWGTVGGGALEKRSVELGRELLDAGETRIVLIDLSELGMNCGGEVTLLIEAIQGRRDFVLFGGGHVGRALASVLDSLGFRVTVYDPRADITARLPDSAEVVNGDYGDISAVKNRLTNGGRCFIATHGHKHDYEVLTQILALPGEARYIGLIGSYRKARLTRERLRKEGLGVPGCLYTPAGLKIGGDSPGEIAVSVAAEVVALETGSDAPHLRLDDP